MIIRLSSLHSELCTCASRHPRTCTVQHIHSPARTPDLPSPPPLPPPTSMQTGNGLVESGHYRSADIQRQMEEVTVAWEQLSEATTEKGRKLKDANELQVHSVCVHVCVCVCACVCVYMSPCEGGAVMEE